MNSDKSIRRRGVYLLPNLLTSAALFAGFYSVISGINGKFEPAAIAIIVAGLLDGLDGRVARLTNTQSDFGEQYDSLSDLISFGLAPALLAFNWSLSSLSEISTMAGKLGWLAAFPVYGLCCFAPGAVQHPGRQLLTNATFRAWPARQRRERLYLRSGFL